MSIGLVNKQFNFKFDLLLYLNALWYMLRFFATLRNINNERFFFICYLCYLNNLKLKEPVSHSINLCIKLLCAKCIQSKEISVLLILKKIFFIVMHSLLFLNGLSFKIQFVRVSKLRCAVNNYGKRSF